VGKLLGSSAPAPLACGANAAGVRLRRQKETVDVRSDGSIFVFLDFSKTDLLFFSFTGKAYV